MQIDHPKNTPLITYSLPNPSELSTKNGRKPTLSGKTFIPITSLLDIIKDKEQLTGVEKVFYHDQNNDRKCSLSEEIDEEWVNEQLAIL